MRMDQDYNEYYLTLKVKILMSSDTSLESKRRRSLGSRSDKTSEIADLIRS
jgi:hypothetical protein